MMVEDNTEKHRTAYTHTVDYTEGASQASLASQSTCTEYFVQAPAQAYQRMTEH